MTTREYFAAHPLLKTEVSRLVIVRKASVAGRVFFILPAGLAGARPRAMLAALNARFPAAVAPIVGGEPVGTRFVRTARRILSNFPAIKAALRMELVS